MEHFFRLSRDSSCHLRLEPPLPAYSNVTIKRALIVWQQCGVQNDFRHVCNYFHHLESLEETLSDEDRARSRAPEFNLLTNHPPISNYLIENFPKLYWRDMSNEINGQEIHKSTLENCVFNFEGFHDMRIKKRANIKDVLKASSIIVMYSKIHSKSLGILFAEFKDFVKKTKTANSVENITIYYQKLLLKDDLTTWFYFPKYFSFLENDEEYMDNVDISDTKTEDLRNGTIETLINESRRKELNMTPKNY